MRGENCQNSHVAAGSLVFLLGMYYNPKHRNETAGTKPPEPLKPPEQPTRNHRNPRNNRNETIGTTETKPLEIQLKGVTNRPQVLFAAIILTYLISPR